MALISMVLFVSPGIAFSRCFVLLCRWKPQSSCRVWLPLCTRLICVHLIPSSVTFLGVRLQLWPRFVRIWSNTSAKGCASPNLSGGPLGLTSQLLVHPICSTMAARPIFVWCGWFGCMECKEVSTSFGYRVFYGGFGGLPAPPSLVRFRLWSKLEYWPSWLAHTISVLVIAFVVFFVTFRIRYCICLFKKKTLFLFAFYS